MLLPLTRKWWPSWDNRTKLNCLQTCIGGAKLIERIRKALEDHDGEPSLRVYLVRVKIGRGKWVENATFHCLVGEGK